MLRSSVALLALVTAPAAAQSLSPAEVSQIDQLVTKTLADTGVPSAEIAIVREGQLVLTKAYGKANEGLPARPDLAYQIAMRFAERELNLSPANNRVNGRPKAIKKG